jgi:hypothetical protein
MSDSKNKSVKQLEKLLVEPVSNPLLFTTNNKRIYNLVVSIQSESSIEGKVYFEYLNKKFECAIVLKNNLAALTALTPSLLTPSGLFTVENEAQKNTQFINELGIITQQGEESIGWLIIDIINHYNSIRLKPKFPNRVRVELN